MHSISSPAVLLTMRNFATLYNMSLVHAPRASRNTEFPWQQTGDRGLPPTWKTGFCQLWTILHCKSIDRLLTKHPQIISSISNFQYGSEIHSPQKWTCGIWDGNSWQLYIGKFFSRLNTKTPMIVWVPWTVVHHAVEENTGFAMVRVSFLDPMLIWNTGCRLTK